MTYGVEKRASATHAGNDKRRRVFAKRVVTQGETPEHHGEELRSTFDRNVNRWSDALDLLAER